jgi:hypothetical protein
MRKTRRKTELRDVLIFGGLVVCTVLLGAAMAYFGQLADDAAQKAKSLQAELNQARESLAEETGPPEVEVYDVSCLAGDVLIYSGLSLGLPTYYDQHLEFRRAPDGKAVHVMGATCIVRLVFVGPPPGSIPPPPPPAFPGQEAE